MSVEVHSFQANCNTLFFFVSGKYLDKVTV